MDANDVLEAPLDRVSLDKVLPLHRGAVYRDQATRAGEFEQERRAAPLKDAELKDHFGCNCSIVSTYMSTSSRSLKTKNFA